VHKDANKIIHEEEANRDREYKEENRNLNEPGYYPLQDIMIFYDWTSA